MADYLGIVLLVLLSVDARAGLLLEGARPYISLIDVSNGGRWGDWAWPEMCPEGFYANGVSFKVEPPQGSHRDDTALNGIRLHCFQGKAQDSMYTVESQSGKWGIWSQPKWCPHYGYLVRFSLRVQPPQHGFLHDNLAATNARFTCSGGETLEPPGPDWGEWGVWSQSCTKGICGIQTRQEAPRGMGKDDTALNDVRFFCCNH